MIKKDKQKIFDILSVQLSSSVAVHIRDNKGCAARANNYTVIMHAAKTTVSIVKLEL